MEQAARMVIGDDQFERLIAGEPLVFDMRPNTTKLIIKLHPQSKYRLTARDILSELQKGLNIPVTHRI